jgi:hypothetical protein
VKFILELIRGDEPDDEEGRVIECDWVTLPRHGDYLDYSAESGKPDAYVIIATWWEIDTGECKVLARQIA